LIAHKLTTLRDERTDSPTFRRLTDELVTLLAYEATREVRVQPAEVTTPVGPAIGVRLSMPKPLVVPILRAGLGMLDGMVRILPTAEVGFLGLMRDEETLVATTYATRLPDDLSGRQCYLLDPMLATGGTLSAAVHYLTDRGADDITAICLLAAPEGLELLERETASLKAPFAVVTAALDERLNDRGYIVPGLGDAGDPGVFHAVRIVDRRRVHPQRDRRVVAAKADALAGEAVATDLHHLGRKFHEHTQVRGPDAVITGGRAGARRRTDPDHLTGCQRLQHRLRHRSGRVGVGSRKPLADNKTRHRDSDQ